MPIKIPSCSQIQLERMSAWSVGQRIAYILEQFLGKKMPDLDITFRLEKNSLRLNCVGHKTYIGELWQNPSGDAQVLEKTIYRAMTAGESSTPSWWARILIRIALLFGLYPILCEHDVIRFHIVTTYDDDVSLLAAWYARKIGLPIDDIVYCCAENSAMWEFFSFGQMSSGSKADAVLEQLIHASFGQNEAVRYLESVRNRRPYLLDEEQSNAFSNGIFPAVVSAERIPALVRSILSTSNYVLADETARAYGGLQDYRSQTGQTGAVLLIATKSPKMKG